MEFYSLFCFLYGFKGKMVEDLVKRVDSMIKTKIFWKNSADCMSFLGGGYKCGWIIVTNCKILTINHKAESSF